jgi:hypothetical protein
MSACRSVGLTLLLVVAATTSVFTSGAHSLVRAQVSFGPQTPHVGEPWHVAVAIQSADAQLHPERRVRLIGTMSGHAMRPVEAELARGADGAFTGSVAFTMRGPWIVTVRVEDLNDILIGGFAAEVVKNEDSTGADELRTMIELHPPVRVNLFPPAWIVGFAIALTLAMQATATIVQRRRREAAATPPRQPLPASEPTPPAPSRA